MKKLALVLVFAASALVPASAPAAGCSPLDCAPTSSALGHGLFAVRPQGLNGTVVVDRLDNGQTKWMLPQGVLTGHTLVHQDGAKLTWYDALTGAQTGTANIHGRNGFVVGTSQDGRSAVLLYTYRGSTTLQIVTPSSQRNVALKGTDWGFDALADSSLYLLRYEKNGYQVRRYDLARRRLVAQPLKDPHESSLIWGTAWSRVTSPDGRYVFTLYLGPDGGAMVHELDVRHSTARCIDLPGSGNFNLGTTYTMKLSGKTLWAVNPGYGRVVGIDVASAKVRVAFRFRAAPSISESPAAPVSDIYGSR
ncbi:MAG TPA: hypothetical protein VJP39_00035, partial [Gaiellaceae bacterium]|nr:hypothetical protein [Gaiellaceae bacterium]